MSVVILAGACCDFHTDLQIKDQKAERLGLIAAIGMRENPRISGSIYNSSGSCTYQDIALRIEYVTPANASLGTEILPISIVVKPNSYERFEIKTQNAPKGWDGTFRLSVESANAAK